MAENTLSVLKIAPGQHPQQVEIDNDLKALQQAVGGSIGASYPFEDPVAIVYRDEYSRERLIARLSTVHPKTITKNARKDTGNTADRHMKQILEIYNGSSRSLSLPVKR